MQQTEKYKFNLLEPGDRVSTQPLNENMTKLDQLATSWGNCRIETGTYVGTGTSGNQYYSTKIKFEILPRLLILYGGRCGAILFQNCTPGFTFGLDYYVRTLVVDWGEDGTVAWYSSHDGTTAQLNASNTTYTYVALYD